MNIFVLDRDADIAATYHNDKHVVKMILESSQLLCNAHHIMGNVWGLKAPYKMTHVNHPCSVWVRQSINNYRWLINLSKSLLKEYTYRYGKNHKTSSVIDWCSNHEPKLPEVSMTSFALAMPDEYKCEDEVRSYRDYYMSDKRHIATWKNREVPTWWK